MYFGFVVIWLLKDSSSQLVYGFPCNIRIPEVTPGRVKGHSKPSMEISVPWFEHQRHLKAHSCLFPIVGSDSQEGPAFLGLDVWDQPCILRRWAELLYLFQVAFSLLIRCLKVVNPSIIPTDSHNQQQKPAPRLLCSSASLRLCRASLFCTFSWYRYACGLKSAAWFWWGMHLISIASFRCTCVGSTWPVTPKCQVTWHWRASNFSFSCLLPQRGKCGL